MTHSQETVVINQFQISSGASFFPHTPGRKFLAPKIKTNMTDIADIDDMTAILTIIALLFASLVANGKHKIHRFSHMHASFWLGIKRCSNRR